MCTPCPRNVQLPLRPRTLLITDVTRLQPFTVGGDHFRENIETLISYNVRTDGIQQDCLYIEQGHLMTPTTFMTYFNGGGSPPVSSCNMDTYKEIFYSAGLPGPHLDRDYPSIPPAKSLPVRRACHTPPNRREASRGPRQVVVNKSTAQLREKKATKKFLNKYPEIFQTNMAQGSNNPPGPFLYQEDGKTYASLPAEMLRNIQLSHLYEKMQKDCKAEGIDIPQTIMAKDPVAHMMTLQEYLQKVAAGQMPKMNNHEMMVKLAAKNDQTQLLMMEFRDVETPKNK